MPRHSADGNRVVAELSKRHAREMREIDDDRGTRHPEVQQGDQRLSPGHNLAGSVRCRKSLHRDFEAVRNNIVEGRRPHSPSPESSLDLTFALQTTRKI